MSMATTILTAITALLLVGCGPKVEHEISVRIPAGADVEKIKKVLSKRIDRHAGKTIGFERKGDVLPQLRELVRPGRLRFLAVANKNEDLQASFFAQVARLMPGVETGTDNEMIPGIPQAANQDLGPGISHIRYATTPRFPMMELPPGIIGMFERDHDTADGWIPLFLVDTERMAPDVVKSAQVDSVLGERLILLSFTEKGKLALATLTEALAPGGVEARSAIDGGRLAILLDRTILTSPKIIEPIVDGAAQISGNFDAVSANQVVTKINTGWLGVEAPLEILSHSTGDTE